MIPLEAAEQLFGFLAFLSSVSTSPMRRAKCRSSRTTAFSARVFEAMASSKRFWILASFLRNLLALFACFGEADRDSLFAAFNGTIAPRGTFTSISLWWRKQ